ncbi:MAG TPA: DUF456 family protein, partial [bacterium]|nr:DUF456 family protein [bacterium]
MDWLSEAGRLVVAWALILAGLAGSFIPSLPGPPLVFAGVLVYCLLSGFSPVGWLSLAVIGAIGALAQVLD